MQLRIRSWLSSIKKMMAIFLLWKQMRLKRPAWSRSSLYLRCNQLPLDRFIDVLIHNNLHALVISGKPRIEDLAEAWGNLWAEYIDLNEDAESLYILILQKEIALLRETVSEIETGLRILHVMYDKRVVKIIEDNGIDLKLNLKNQSEYFKGLERASQRTGFMKTQLRIKQKELNEYLAGKEGEEMNEKYFRRWLSRLSKFMGIRLRAKDITVAEFVTDMKECLEYHNSHNKTLEHEYEGQNI
jgi:hypothetical protein